MLTWHHLIGCNLTQYNLGYEFTSVVLSSPLVYASDFHTHTHTHTPIRKFGNRILSPNQSQSLKTKGSLLYVPKATTPIPNYQIEEKWRCGYSDTGP